MDASDLRMFEAVARLGAIGRAAAELHTVQSNVTMRIRALEHDLGCALFDRHSRRVTLTDAGTRLLPYTQEVADVLLRARRAVLDDGTPRGPLTIGSLETTAGLRLPPVLASFCMEYPAVDLTLRTGTTAELIAGVLARRLEGAFVAGPVDHPDLLQSVVFREELVLVTAPTLRWVPDLRQVDGLRILVLRTGCSYRQRLEALLAARGILNVRCLEFGSLDVILGCVSAGMGITLLPRAVVAPAQRAERVAVHALPEAEATVDTLFVRRHDGRMTSALVAFLRHARGEPISEAAA